ESSSVPAVAKAGAAAVDGDPLAINVRRPGGHQEGHHVSDVLWAAHAPVRTAGVKLRRAGNSRHGPGQRVAHLGGDKSWRYDVDVYPVAHLLDRERRGERLEGRLGHHVRAAAGYGPL